MKLNYLSIVLLILFLAGCREESIIPKPKAQIRLEYPQGELATLETDDFMFQYNRLARAEANKDQAFIIDYPDMKGSIFISYKKVGDDLNELIRDAEKLSYEHASKGQIIPYPFVNPDEKVYGALFEVQGDAASQSQFFVTDSTEHFLTGSVYFYTKPNYDSILPAAAYLQNDVRRIMETLRWKK
ncbi:gliding motility lipoprotein GldD [Maribacter sp. 2304DJ31-5]|uniref:gliding motility lipoprotein GldD n=1 Tax=Maribacter sp. 2304DJ31-5 TaxID=3386273 RepID=UPI0039BCEB06